MMERFYTFGIVGAARRDRAYGKADLGNERGYGEEAEVHMFLSSVIIRKNSAGG